MGAFGVDRLWFDNPTMRTFNLDIQATLLSEADVGWISHVKVSLFHHRRLIGEKILHNTYIIPDENKEATISLESFEIRDMTAFRGFFEHLMPENDIEQKASYPKGVTAALARDENGHELSISIDLVDVSKLSISHLRFDRSCDMIHLSFFLRGPSPVDLDFGSCQFLLRKNGTVLAILHGDFAIQKGDSQIRMEGTVEELDDEVYTGLGTLTGFKTYEHNNSFLAHALRLFEIRVKLS